MKHAVEGRLLIEIGVNRGCVREVNIASNRPSDAPRLFHGQPPECAAAMISLLYTLCARAQTVAALQACAAALDIHLPGGLMRTWNFLVQGEIAYEHLWRIHLDWPGMLGLANDPGSYFELRRALDAKLSPLIGSLKWRHLESFTEQPDAIIADFADSLERHLCEHVFGMPPDELYRRESPAELPPSLFSEVVYHLRDTAGTGRGVGLMPAVALLEGIHESMFEQDFARFPSRDGEPLETGPLARMKEHPMLRGIAPGVLSRFLARMLELAALPHLMRDAPGSDLNVAGCVETARGLLLHRAEIADGLIGRYSIVAPTEWNFHPDGALVRGLLGMPVDCESALRRIAQLSILALDPCVGYELRIVNHA